MKSLWIPECSAFIRFHDLPGAEPAIVLLHGLGSASSADFPAIAHQPALSRLRFVLPDFFGFGFSDGPDNFDYSLQSHAETIYQILRSLDLSNVYLFGHSMGGAVAIALTATHPKLIDRLVLAETNLDPCTSQASKTIAAQSESDYVAKGHTQFLKSIEQEIQHTPSLSCYVGALKMADPKAMHRSAVGLTRGTVPSRRQLFLSMKMPRAFIFGKYSLPDPDVEYLRSCGINVLIVPKAGHAMMHDNPEGFATALLQSFQL
jgi:pimeloyl-ACP methyl ester carboxylesterase